MNKRTDTIRSLFMAPQSEALSADNTASARARVSAGSVRALSELFSGFERENEKLREQIASGDLVVAVDPALVDASPIIDRFEDPHDPAFEALKASLRERGQEVPVLIRVHPSSPGRYQSAYGHRRGARGARTRNSSKGDPPESDRRGSRHRARRREFSPARSQLHRARGLRGKARKCWL